MNETEPGRLLAGRYRLLSVMGHGGMGVVWRGRDEVLNRDVAVKEILWPHLTDEEQQVASRRAVREAQMAGRLSHHNVVRIYDIVEEDNHPSIVMELLPYRSLRDRIREDGPLPPDEAARVGLGVLAALRAAHAEGILHRDVKPANILIGPDGRVVLTDFGIARAADSPTLTNSGALLGSPSYIAPERAMGQKMSGAAGVPSDLWGLGASLYAAVEGHPPFERGSALATLTDVVAGELAQPAHAGLLAPVIEGLLRKDPQTRLGAGETERMLRRAVAEPEAGEPAARAVFTPRPPTPAAPPGRESPVWEYASWDVPSWEEPILDEPGHAPATEAPTLKEPEAPAAQPPTAEKPSAGEAPAGPPAAGEASAGAPAAELPAASASAGQAAAGDVAAGQAQAGDMPDVGPAAAREATREAAAAEVPASGALAAEVPAARAAHEETAARLLMPAPMTDELPAGQAKAEPESPGRPRRPGLAARRPLGPRQLRAARGPRSSRRLAVVIAALAVIAAGVTALAFNLTSAPGGPSAAPANSTHPALAHSPAATGSPAASSAPATPRTSPGASSAARLSPTPGTPSNSASASGTGTSPTYGTLPAGFYRFTNSTGFSIGVPDGWRISHQGHYVYVTDPANADIYLLIDQSDHPKPNALTDWKQQQANRASGYPDYHLIRLVSVNYPQAEQAADWEFTYVNNGTLMHILNRNILANASHAYALYWSTPASDWSADYHYFQTFAATFVPAPA